MDVLPQAELFAALVAQGAMDTQGVVSDWVMRANLLIDMSLERGDLYLITEHFVALVDR